MKCSRIVFLPDLLRDVRYTPEGFFDFIFEPILQGCAIDLETIDTISACGFEIEKFHNLVGFSNDNKSSKLRWEELYFNINKSALDYLFYFLHEDNLILSFEIPPWLAQECIERNVNFIDIRVSPLRFGRDLYIALSCSNIEHAERISSFTVTEEELRLEASTLSANVRMHQLRLKDEQSYNFDSLKDSVLFIGQAPYDASLLSKGGCSLRCTDFSSKLQNLCKGKRLLYKAHPFAHDFAEEERIKLEGIVGCQVLSCGLSAYQILSSHDNVQLIGISSSMLQEAKWFNKTAHILYKSYVPIASKNNCISYNYQQIHFQTFLSPGFWHQVLTPERPAPRLARLTSIAHNYARETLNHWWDYSKVLTWERTLPYESFMRNGGAEFRDRITELEDKVKNLSASSSSYNIVESKDDRLKIDLLITLYSRLASGYKCPEDVFSKNKSPAIYINKNLNAEYYQELHDKNILFKSNNWLMPYLELIVDKKYRIVREVGCGNGAFSSAIAKSVDKVIGLDWAKSPDFPEAFNIFFEQKDITEADLEIVDLNCSADVLEHIKPEKLPFLIKSLHESSKANFHVIACYDDGHSHLSIFPPDAWLFLFKQVDPNYRILDISIRHDNISHIVCVVSNI